MHACNLPEMQWKQIQEKLLVQPCPAKGLELHLHIRACYVHDAVVVSIYNE